MSDYYDVKIKRFADGTVQYSASVIYVPLNNFVLSPGIERVSDPDPVRSKRNSYKRVVQRIYDLAHANIWDYFITLTLDSRLCTDRYDYCASINDLQHFTDLLYRAGALYLIVPERHKDGAWHFHGLINSLPADHLYLNDNGYYSIKDYKYGFTSVDCVRETSRVSNYILKYMLKGDQFLDIPKGKRRFFASRGLNEPDVSFDVMTEDQIQELLDQSYYQKKICNDWYDGYIIDVKEF